LALGRTVAELKQTMSMPELAMWQAYVTENGPLNAPLRIEWAIARAAAPFMGRGIKARQLAPLPREPEPEGNPSAAEAFALFKGLAMKTRAANGK